jgi:hypothetical protein
VPHTRGSGTKFDWLSMKFIHTSGSANNWSSFNHEYRVTKYPATYYFEIPLFLFAVVVSADDHIFLAKKAVFCMEKRINRTSALSATAFRTNERLVCAPILNSSLSGYTHKPFVRAVHPSHSSLLLWIVPTTLHFSPS